MHLLTSACAIITRISCSCALFCSARALALAWLIIDSRRTLVMCTPESFAQARRIERALLFMRSSAIFTLRRRLPARRASAAQAWKMRAWRSPCQFAITRAVRRSEVPTLRSRSSSSALCSC